MPRTTAPRAVSLPPVRVEPDLHEALVAIAASQGRTLSDVIRSYLREAVGDRASAAPASPAP